MGRSKRRSSYSPLALDCGVSGTLSIKIAQKPYIIASLGPKALTYKSFEGKG